ncbi:MAG: phospholipid carrier-dependent glycosyltransferase [Thermoguttaceae bacterium]
MTRVRGRLALLLILALAIRLAAGWAWQSRIGDRLVLGDSESYWQLGRAIAEGKPYEYGPEKARIFRAPGYPALLAPVFWISSDRHIQLLLARAEAALLGALAVLGVWWLARLLFDDRAAWIAGLIAAFYPGGIALSVLILSEAPFCPLMLLQLALWTLAGRAPTRRSRIGWSFAAGLAAGMATLMRPDWLLFTPVAVIVDVLWRRASGPSKVSSSSAEPTGVGSHSSTKRHRLHVACWMMLGLVLVLLPWWVRNACLTGRFVPTTLQVGASLYDGLNPEATGASNMDFVARFVADLKGQGGPPPGNPAFEVALNRTLRDSALHWAATHPGRAVQLAAVKLARLWNIWPNEPQLARSPIVRWGVVFTYTPLLILAIIGVWRTLGRGWPYRLCWLPAVYLTLLHVVFVSSLRYREPAMLALLALAAGAVAFTFPNPAARGTHATY